MASLMKTTERELVAKATESREVQMVEQASIWPLGHERRNYGVLVLEGCPYALGQMMSQLFFQWTAVADFMSVEKAELIDENFQLREEIRTQFSDRNIIGVSGAFPPRGG